jgi:hypothetical protein
MDSNEIEAGSFPNYTLDTNETGIWFYVFVFVYSTLSFLLIAPLVIWGRQYQQEREDALARAGFYNQRDEFAVVETNNRSNAQETHPLQNSAMPSSQQQPNPFQDPRIQQPVYAPLGARTTAVRHVFRGIDRVSAIRTLFWLSGIRFSSRFLVRRWLQPRIPTTILIICLFYQDHKIERVVETTLPLRMYRRAHHRQAENHNRRSFRVQQQRLDCTPDLQLSQRLKFGMYMLEDGSQDDLSAAPKSFGRPSRMKPIVWAVRHMSHSDAPYSELNLCTTPTSYMV